MKLDKHEIQFIDNYLQKHDVVFVDIRAEMIDHIATAVEDKMDKEAIDFYDAFKGYMITNRKDILKNNKNNFGISFSEIKKFGLFLIKPQLLFLFVLLFAVSKTLQNNQILNYFIANSSRYFFVVNVYYSNNSSHLFLFLSQETFLLYRKKWSAFDDFILDKLAFFTTI